MDRLLKMLRLTIKVPCSTSTSEAVLHSVFHVMYLNTRSCYALQVQSDNRSTCSLCVICFVCVGSKSNTVLIPVFMALMLS